MLELLAKLIATKKLSFESGEINLFTEHMFFIPVSFFTEETKFTLKNKKRMLDFYFSAWKAGVQTMQNFTDTFKLTKFEDRYNLAMQILQLAGTGDYKTIEFKQGKYSHFHTKDDTLAKSFYPYKDPLCHFIRGINAGGGSVVHECIMNCVEEKCAAQTNDECIFVNMNTELLQQKASLKLVKSQLGDVKKLIENQKKFIRENNHTKFVKI